ncbi:MAG: hypothetical protein HFH29_06920 [Eubacterium sp.]|nr:hypothetical protein [Eubacterium sp.]
MVKFENPLSAWMGEIPIDWEKRKLKYIFSIKKEIAGEEGHTVLSITQQGIIPKNMDAKGQFASDYSKYQLVKQGDFAMNHMDLLTGWVDVSEYDGVTSPDYRVFVLDDKDEFDSDYYKYIFQLCYKHRIFYSLGQGVSGFGRWRLPADMFLNFELPVPTHCEQYNIGVFLKRHITVLEEIIECVNNSIADYKAVKLSYIREMISGKNRKNRKTKPCNIDGIESIPCEWDTCRLRFLCDVMTGDQDTQNADDNGIYPFYVRSPIVERANTYTYEGEGILMAGDGAGAGRVFHYANGRYAIHQRVYCFHNFRNITPRYFLYYIENMFPIVMDQGSAKSTVPSVRLPMIKDFVFTLPKEEEQIEIVKLIENRCGKINALISEKEELIKELESYKISLIYDYVTGKRKVV